MESGKEKELIENGRQHKTEKTDGEEGAACSSHQCPFKTMLIIVGQFGSTGLSNITTDNNPTFLRFFLFV